MERNLQNAMPVECAQRMEAIREMSFFQITATRKRRDKVRVQIVYAFRRARNV